MKPKPYGFNFVVNIFPKEIYSFFFFFFFNYLFKKTEQCIHKTCFFFKVSLGISEHTNKNLFDFMLKVFGLVFCKYINGIFLSQSKSICYITNSNNTGLFL